MALFINTNIVGLSIQGNLGAAQDATAVHTQRLSSGLRINAAKDDAAGLAIADQMYSIISGQTTAMRNANDAISFSQTAAGGLNTITNALASMRELAVQAANFPLSDTNRAALDKQFVSLQSLINQVSQNTLFNGQNVFNGSARVFQIGYGVSANNQISFQGTDLTATTSATALVVYQNNGVTLATVNSQTNAFIAAGGTFNTSDGSPIGGGALDTTLALFANNIDAADQAIYDQAKTVFINSHGSFSASNGSAVLAKSGTTTVGGHQVPAATAADLAAYNTFSTAQNSYYAAAKGIQILDQPSSLASITAIDKALVEIDSEKAKQGAFKNRLTQIVTDLQTSITNQSAARSRIMDTDYASETASLARSQIMQQASLAMLSQANHLQNNQMAVLLNSQFFMR